MVLMTMKSVVIKGYDNIGFLMLTNLLFIAVSALIITIPVTVLILSALTGNLVNGKIPDVKGQLKQAITYFVKGGLLALLSVIITVVLVIDCYFLLNIRRGYPWVSHLLLGFILCLLAIWLLMQIYIIPMFFSQNLVLAQTFKRAFLLVLDNFIPSLAFGGLFLAIIGLMMVTGVGPFLLLFSLLFLMQNQIFVNVMEKYHGQYSTG
jgi:uncharacterized membrane protein YesL